MDTYEVQAADATTTSTGTPIWMVTMRKPDGSIHCHTFPPSTIEWRMAEYELVNPDEALDIVLHEPYLPDAPGRDDAALRVGLVTSTRPDAEAITLFNAASTADARAAHRLRVADAKTSRVQVLPPSGEEDPLNVIRANHGVTARGIRAKRERVDIARWQMVYGELPVPLSPERPLLGQ
ncbi:hypothetical protein [Streptomyces spinosisporus]|uniref:Uncharacterized protein n=1 Tax=Streptomyces spinosisporus TaxID=2927582 RepID=A0ABS9XW40_9ACTN|nr:hypothetical protein [Streptomyces spinosisporus]MCI3246300.1 hypothetical protein [Streptomyces spinosisporus]